MPNPSLTVAMMREAVAAVEEAVEAGHKFPVEALKVAARALGLHKETLRHRLNEARDRLGLRVGDGAATATIASDARPPQEARSEARDAAFWRTRAKSLEAELADAEHAIRQVAGVVEQPSAPAAWLLPDPNKTTGRAVISCLLTDIHLGEVIDPDELAGMNAFNVDIARNRVRRYVAAACELGSRWAADCEVVGALLMLGGDLISGDIHEELRITNEVTSHEQVSIVVEEVIAAIGHLKATYGRVHVVSVPGNHGRTTPKPTSKLYSRLSYDTLIAKIVSDRLAGDSAVSFQISPGRDAIIPVLGRTVLLTHGDGMGTGGGMGFAGPMLPIVRGTKKVEAQQARANRRPDLICHGHFHSSGNPFGVLANGSVPGYSQYGNQLRAALEPPMQWLFLMHQKWGLRERCEIQLEDPQTPPRPRVRIPAVMAKE